MIHDLRIFTAVSTLITIRLASVSCRLSLCVPIHALYCLVPQVFTVAKMQSMRISTLAR